MKIIALIILSIYLNTTVAQTFLGTEFTYQGELNNTNGNPHNGDFDFKFIAYDALDDGLGNNLGTSLAADVAVSQGIFTTQIDFGDNAFVGNKVWLEISVRTGASTGAYTKLLPRQQITVAPYATHAQFVGADAVSGIEIQDGSIMSADLSNDSVTISQIASNAVGNNEIISSQVQNRVNGTCGANQFITKINEAGSVDCATDNTGLTIVTSSDIVDGTVKAIDIDNTEIQQRVGGSCDNGFYLNGINQDGTVLCKILPIDMDFTLDSEGRVGSHSSITIGMDNNPIISYYDSINDILKAYKCSNVICSAGTSYTLDSGDVGINSSITIGLDGNPIISYSDDANNDLKVYKCSNPFCSAGSALTIDSTDSVGRYSSIIIRSSHNPIISYYDNTNDSLKIYSCVNTSCSAGLTETLDSLGNVGFYTSIAIGADNYPIISYYDDTNKDLKVYKCNNSSCSTGTARTLDSIDDVGAYTSIAIGADNNPIISYYDYTNGNLKMYKCNNPSCLTGTALTLDSTDNVGRDTNIVIGMDSNPIISYSDSTNADLKMYKCSNISCSVGAVTILDTAGVNGVFSSSSLTIGTDSHPIISYSDETNGDLKVYSCADESCR